MVGEDVATKKENTPRREMMMTSLDVMTPDAELAQARHYLSGWTLERYTARFRAEQQGSPPSSHHFPEAGEGGDGGDGDGVTLTVTPGTGGGGWTRVGPPPSSTGPSQTHAVRRIRRRRPSGILTVPTCATVGQVREKNHESEL